MIRNARDQDFNFIYSLYMHPEVNPFLLYELMDAESFAPIFHGLKNSGQLYIYEKENVPAGMFKLIRLTHRTSHVAYLGGVAILPEFRGNGAAVEMMKEALVLGREMGLLRMELSATITNERAIKFYEKMGFEKEGVLRKYSHFEKEDFYVDEQMMGYLYN